MTKRGSFVIRAVTACGVLSVGQSVAQDAPDLSALQSAPINAATAPGPGSYSVVSVSEYMTVDMFVNRAPVTEVLQQLALQSRRNIIPSNGVAGTVTANLTDVAFFDALEAVLHPNGHGYLERGDFIFVYTREELAAIQEVEERPQVRVVHLDYLLASDAVAFAEPLLSPRGSVQATADNPPEDSGTQTDFGEQEQIVDPVYDPERNRYAMGNAVVVYDFPQFADEVEALLRALDTRPAQVLIEATVLQTTLNENNGFGVDFAFLPEVQLTQFLNPTDGFPFGDLEEGTPTREQSFSIADNRDVVGTEAIRPSVEAGIFIGDDIGIFISALDQVSDVSLLANPKVMALNRQRARVFVGARIGYLVSTIADGVVVQEVEFVNEGIELDFRPFIQDDNAVRLELSPRVSDVVIRTTEAPPGGVPQEVPDQALQTVTTHVTVPKGTTAVLGGLFQENTNLTRRQVPLLGDLPLVGGAFRGTNDIILKDEIVFLVKPTIMSDARQALQGEEADAVVDRVRTGTRRGLLPWSTSQQTSRLNLKAEQLAAEGKTEEALWAIRRSLELRPKQEDAIRLREDLLNRADWTPNESMLDRISRAHVNAMLSRLGRAADGAERDAEAAAVEAARDMRMPEAERRYNLVPMTPAPADDEGSAEGAEDAAVPPGDDDPGAIPELPDIPDIPELP